LRRGYFASPNRAFSIGCGAICESCPASPSLGQDRVGRFEAVNKTVANNSEKVKILAHDSDGQDTGGRRSGINLGGGARHVPKDRARLLSSLHNSALDR
jgi:hypothetical protein